MGEELYRWMAELVSRGEKGSELAEVGGDKTQLTTVGNAT